MPGLLEFSSTICLACILPAVQDSKHRVVPSRGHILTPPSERLPVGTAKVPFGAKEMLAEMVEQIGQVDFITFQPILEP